MCNEQLQYLLSQACAHIIIMGKWIIDNRHEVRKNIYSEVKSCIHGSVIAVRTPLRCNCNGKLQGYKVPGSKLIFGSFDVSCDGKEMSAARFSSMLHSRFARSI